MDVNFIEISKMVLEKAINNSGKDKADIFVSYSPHVQWVDVSIHVPKWKKGSNPNIMFTVYGDGRVLRRNDVLELFGKESSYEELLNTLEEYEDVD
jgi:hypothetical protein